MRERLGVPDEPDGPARGVLMVAGQVPDDVLFAAKHLAAWAETRAEVMRLKGELGPRVLILDLVKSVCQLFLQSESP
jgi:hypothetical protein